MELGNIVFGNSGGEYPVPRGVGWEDELYRLFDAYAPDRDNSWREYGVEFKNDTFAVMPYYWWYGDCPCGYDKEEWQWIRDHKHEPHCYQVALKDATARWLDQNPEPEARVLDLSFEEPTPGIVLITSAPARGAEANKWREWSEQKRDAESRLYDKLCTEYSLDRGFGCAVHCTCDRQARWKAFVKSHDHHPDCPVVRPNFVYMPTGFAIQWYKYPLRDSYMNQDITLKEFRAIISRCIESLPTPGLRNGGAAVL